mmetsp:Transcript_3632/g.6356  ORF Transcript_3632/g.6356 Transcript_3632/m.6356 type:complete len:136 (-) Transcript_3632:1934-2341(-)
MESLVKPMRMAFLLYGKVLMKIVRSIHPDALSHLVVIGWTYNGLSASGMPPSNVLEQMHTLEKAIEEKIVRDTYSKHVDSKTDINRRELVHYTHDTALLTPELNIALASHPLYPSLTTFCFDADWRDLRPILSML